MSDQQHRDGLKFTRREVLEVGTVVSVAGGLLDEPDTQLNISGAKGVGEVAMVGATAAIVNAVHHATGKRIRHLPIRIEDLLTG